MHPLITILFNFEFAQSVPPSRYMLCLLAPKGLVHLQGWKKYLKDNNYSASVCLTPSLVLGLLF